MIERDNFKPCRTPRVDTFGSCRRISGTRWQRSERINRFAVDSSLSAHLELAGIAFHKFAGCEHYLHGDHVTLALLACDTPNFKTEIASGLNERDWFAEPDAAQPVDSDFMTAPIVTHQDVEYSRRQEFNLERRIHVRDLLRELQTAKLFRNVLDWTLFVIVR